MDESKIFYKGKPYRVVCGPSRYKGKICYVIFFKDENLGHSFPVPIEEPYGDNMYIYVNIPMFQFKADEQLQSTTRVPFDKDFIEPLEITDEILLFQKINLKWAFWLEANHSQLRKMATSCLLNEDVVYDSAIIANNQIFSKEKMPEKGILKDAETISFLQWANLRWALKLNADYRTLEKMADDGILDKDKIFDMYQTQEKNIMS